ncbi:glucose PTS transporter subunit IIA (plasmid) [Peribacillus sp. JNUCC 23]
MGERIVEQIIGISKGEVVPLKKVNDPIFADEIMGKGIAIKPEIGEIYAPFDGTVVSVFPSKHAISLKSNNGCELLIHIGIDTVKLNGVFFEPMVTENDSVQSGDLIMKFNLNEIEQNGYDSVIPIVILNSSSYEVIEFTCENHASKEKVLIGLEKIEAENQIENSNEHINIENRLESSIISALGGEKNIRSMGHCATRLRVTLNNDKLVDRERLKNISGVLGVVDSMGGLQIVIGNTVNKVYQNIRNFYNVGANDDAKENVKGSIVNRVLNVLSDILSPTVPLIMASGFVSALLVVLSKIGMNQESSTYTILSTAANVVFYFLPILLAYTSSVRFKCNTIYSLFIGGLMLHPNILELVKIGENIDLFKIPITLIDYSSSLIPIILSIWVLSYVEKFADRYVPDAAKYVFKPLLIILIMLPITLGITGPTGFLLGKGLGSVLSVIYSNASWLAILLVASLAPLLVMTGMHIALTPILILSNFENLGYDNLLLIAFIGMNFSQFAVALAVMLKTKKNKLRQLAANSAFTAFFSGITEPTLYGITIRLKKPLYATFIGCIANGIFCAIANVKIFAFAPPSFFTLPIFMNPDGTNTNFILALCSIGITIVVTFLATWMFSFDDAAYDN